MGSALPGYPTLIDLAKANGSDQVTGLIDETTRLVPSVRFGSVRTIKGRNYKTLTRTLLPIASFRNANQGANVVKATYVNRLVDTFILNPRWECDKAVADGYEYGAAAYAAMEASGIMEAAMQALGRQFYYGNNTWSAPAYYASNPASPIGATLTMPIGVVTLPTNTGQGFPGLIDQYNTTYQVTAGGTTVASATSVWAVKWGDKFLNWVYGDNGYLQPSDLTLQRVLDSASNPFDAYCQSVTCYPGLQIGDLRGVARIINITDDAGKGMTDTLAANLMATIPGGMFPDCWFMNRRAWTQLRNSRTATNPTGAPAPLPDEIFGIPIFIDDSIQNNEPLNYYGAVNPQNPNPE